MAPVPEQFVIVFTLKRYGVVILPEFQTLAPSGYWLIVLSIITHCFTPSIEIAGYVVIPSPWNSL